MTYKVGSHAADRITVEAAEGDERAARVVSRDATLERVQQYLPRNYTASERNGVIWISGRDQAGWTLDEYVIPRLASGLIFAEEVSSEGQGQTWAYKLEKQAGIQLTNVTNPGLTGNIFEGTDSSGNRVRFRASDEDADKIRHVLLSDMAINFTGVTIDESDIVTASKLALKYKDLPDGLGMPQPQMMCSEFGEEHGVWSAHRGDYFMANDDDDVTCSECGAPMTLGRMETRWVEGSKVAKRYVECELASYSKVKSKKDLKEAVKQINAGVSGVDVDVTAYFGLGPGQSGTMGIKDLITMPEMVDVALQIYKNGSFFASVTASNGKLKVA